MAKAAKKVEKEKTKSTKVKAGKAKAVLEKNTKVKATKKVAAPKKTAASKLKAAVEKTTRIYSLKYIESVVDGVEVEKGIMSSTGASAQRTSTGLLAMDLILGGGLRGGSWYTFAGPEQSSKSTLAYQTIVNAVFLGVPHIQVWDYEGSFDPDYVFNIAISQGFKGKFTDLFGHYDEQTDRWVIEPRIRKYEAAIAEDFFDMIARVSKALPDKRNKNGKWYLVFKPDPKDPENEERKSLSCPKLYKKTKRYWIESDDIPQVCFVTDSLPAMLPRDTDQKADEKGERLAMQAQMFSDQLKRVKGRFASKQITVLAINQIRKIPMAMYGPTEEEPCGQAVRFYSDVRLHMKPRSSVFGNKGFLEYEDSLIGEGQDVYRYINVKSKKNKTAPPDQEGWLRIWVTDELGVARGYDPVFDTYIFMKEVGLLKSTDTKKDIVLNLEALKIKDKLPDHKLSWMDFKKLVAGTKPQREEIFQKKLKMKKPVDLRALCFKYVKTKECKEAWFNNLSKKPKKT